MCDLHSAAENVAQGVRHFDLKRGQRFKIQGSDAVFVFDHMDGMYGHQYTERGELAIFYCDDLVELLESER